jgi:thiamine-phosphate pyrophosphorylase
MSQKRKIEGLYAIADSTWCPRPTIMEYAKDLLAGGCRIIQLRIKESRDVNPETREKVLANAKEIIRLKDEFDFTFIVNDYPDVACELGADGVHVGENDMPVSELRRMVGDGMIVGYSSHDVDEARSAISQGADYVALGAVFPTATKGPGHPVQGIESLRGLVESVDRPVVAIGGIGRNNVDDVMRSGASAVAMITALAKADDVVAETRWYVERLSAGRPGVSEVNG